MASGQTPGDSSCLLGSIQNSLQKSLHEDPIHEKITDANRYVSIVLPSGERVPARLNGVDSGKLLAEVYDPHTHTILVREITPQELSGMRVSSSSAQAFATIPSVRTITDANRYFTMQDASGARVMGRLTQISGAAEGGPRTYVAEVVDPRTGQLHSVRLDQEHLRTVQLSTESRDYFRKINSPPQLQKAQAAPAPVSPAAPAVPPIQDAMASTYAEDRQYWMLEFVPGKPYPVRILKQVQERGKNTLLAEVRDAATGEIKVRPLYDDELNLIFHPNRNTNKTAFENFKGFKAVEADKQMALDKTRQMVDSDSKLLGAELAPAMDNLATTEYSIKNLSSAVSAHRALSDEQQFAVVRLVDHYDSSLKPLESGQARHLVSELAAKLSRIQEAAVYSMDSAQLQRVQEHVLSQYPDAAKGTRPRSVSEYLKKIESAIAGKKLEAEDIARKAAAKDRLLANDLAWRNSASAPDAAKPLTGVQRDEVTKLLPVLKKRPSEFTDQDIVELKKIYTLMEIKKNWSNPDPYQPSGMIAVDRELAKQFDEAYAKLKFAAQPSDSFYLAKTQRRVIENPKVTVNEYQGPKQSSIARQYSSLHAAQNATPDFVKIRSALEVASPGKSYSHLLGVAEYLPVIQRSSQISQITQLLATHGIQLKPGELDAINALTTVDAMNVDRALNEISSARDFLKQLRAAPGGVDGVRNLNNRELNELLDTIEFQTSRYIPSGLRNLP